MVSKYFNFVIEINAFDYSVYHIQSVVGTLSSTLEYTFFLLLCISQQSIYELELGEISRPNFLGLLERARLFC